jgi:nucleotide-binding universal stress UspA family protein
VDFAVSPANLLEVCSREHAAMVVMATHGRSGVARATLGSVADQVVRHGQCPTLLVRARGRLAERPPLADALLPLDGSAMSEVALPTLASLAGTLVKRVTLLRVVDPDARSGAADGARQSLAATRERIEREMEALRGQVETLVVWGAPAQQILEEAGGHDLIIMATHGESGATRWAFGSVADEVLHNAHTPLLLTRPHTRAAQ